MSSTLASRQTSKERVRSSSGRVLSISLDDSTKVPLHRQIYNEIRSHILSGRLKAHTLLPSTRALALDVRVARSTVVLAYDQLRAEGYLVSQPGGGTRVTRAAPEISMRTVSAVRGARVSGGPRQLPVLPRAAVELRGTLTMGPRAPRAFRAGVPAVDAFPVELWTRSVTRAQRRAPGRQLAYGDPFGLPALREAVADYLTAARGVRCSADNVMIVGGSQHALTLCASALIAPGDEVWLEDPFYVGARGAFELARASIVPVGIDSDGLIVSEGVARAPHAKLAFVTPSRQLPLGVTMSLARRLELLDWAARSGGWIIEDDYDSEFRFTSRPITALQGLDEVNSVIYVGTFSKVMFPSLRLAYIVVPESLREVMLTVRTFSNFHAPYLEQAALADFMAAGHFERHIRRMRMIYAERAKILVDSLRARLGNRFPILDPTAGMTLVVPLRPDDDAAAIARIAVAAGVDVVPTSAYTIAQAVPPALLFGYSGLDPRAIREGAATFAEAVRRYDAQRA
jgi:GntR family transcriptional regulator/MocR family aminotransferase